MTVGHIDYVVIVVTSYDIDIDIGVGTAATAGAKSLKSKMSNVWLRVSVNNHVSAEQAAAGWLTAVAAEAIHGWVPLRADGSEK